MIKQNFVNLYVESFRDNWDLPALSDYTEQTSLYYKDLAREVARMHILLEQCGIEKGDKVALIGKNNIPWCVTYLGVVTFGAVVVPILQDFHADSVQHIVNHSDARVLFSSNSIWDTLDEEQLPLIEYVFSISDLAYKNLYEREGDLSMNALPFQSLFQQEDDTVSDTATIIEEQMSLKYPKGYAKEDVVYPSVDNALLMVISYTSGTTGFSKGVMLTGNNLAGNLQYAHQKKLMGRGQNILSFLPLAHAYGCAFEFLYALSLGAHTTLLGKTPSPKILTQAFADVKPSLIILVPLIIEKIYKKGILPKIQGAAAKAALKIPFLKDQLYALIRKNLVDAMGGNFKEVIIGGAALNKEVEEFLFKIKFPFTVGYGMTECGPLISHDSCSDFVPSSCGKILDGTMEVRIDSPEPYSILGEVQVRGENVMLGYYKNEEATKAAFTADGWLKTGDLGTIDKDNRIYLRGRSKTMLLGASGQNIFPEEIEDKLNNLSYIAESLLVERNNKLVALVHPDYETMDASGVKHEMLPAIMEEHRIKLNKMLAHYENITAIQIFPSEFEKTPKKSIKRYLYEN